MHLPISDPDATDLFDECPDHLTPWQFFFTNDDLHTVAEALRKKLGCPPGGDDFDGAALAAICREWAEAQ